MFALEPKEKQETGDAPLFEGRAVGFNLLSRETPL